MSQDPKEVTKLLESGAKVVRLLACVASNVIRQIHIAKV